MISARIKASSGKKVIEGHAEKFLSECKKTLGPVYEELKNDKELLVGCVSGAILKQDYLDLLEKAGFSDITIHKEMPAFLEDYGLSITFSAFK